jgi:uncharacterized protein (TIGR03435 family)
MLLAIPLILAPRAFSQAVTTPQPAVKTFSYEVVSIKPHKPSNDSSWRTTDDDFSAQGMTVRALVKDAYGLITDDQLTGLPEWATTDQFDIHAKMDADTSDALKKLSEKERGRQYENMLQGMLADRFQLKAHRETKVIPVYALVAAKGGAKLKETAPNVPMGYGINSSSSGSTMSGHGMDMTTLIYGLSGDVGRVIIDQTGLTGKYDMDLKWSSEENQNADDSAPPIFTALQEQLGLKLESTKAPVETIVVDHIDKPSAN